MSDDRRMSDLLSRFGVGEKLRIHGLPWATWIPTLSMRLRKTVALSPSSRAGNDASNEDRSETIPGARMVTARTRRLYQQRSRRPVFRGQFVPGPGFETGKALDVLHASPISRYATLTMLLSLYNMWLWTGVFIVVFAVAESFFPRRTQYKFFSLTTFSELSNGLIFFYASVGIYWLASSFIEPWLWQQVAAAGYPRLRYNLQLLGGFGIPAQAFILLIVLDFGEWFVHGLMHRVPWLWTFHKSHHSIRSDEMRALAGYRFHWFETVVYRSILYLPLIVFAVSPVALFWLRTFTLFTGFFTHANLNIDLGPLKYILNTPRMHRWHHDYELRAGKTWNFGVRLSVWDWIFRTAYLPPGDVAPDRLGFAGEQKMLNNAIGHQLYPLVRRRG